MRRPCRRDLVAKLLARGCPVSLQDGVPRVTWVLAKQPWASKLAWTEAGGVSSCPSQESRPHLTAPPIEGCRPGHSRTRAAHRMSGKEAASRSSRLGGAQAGGEESPDSLCGFWRPRHSGHGVASPASRSAPAAGAASEDAGTARALGTLGSGPSHLPAGAGLGGPRLGLLGTH